MCKKYCDNITFHHTAHCCYEHYTTFSSDTLVSHHISFQPILSETMLDQLVADGVVPAGVSPESYLDVVVSGIFPAVYVSLPSPPPPPFPPYLGDCVVQSLQIAIFLFTVCHVVMVVLESKDAEVMLRCVCVCVCVCMCVCL